MVHKIATFSDVVLDRQVQDIVSHLQQNVFGIKVAVPSTATSDGKVGNWAADTSYLYIYTGDGTTHTWRRVAISTW